MLGVERAGTVVGHRLTVEHAVELLVAPHGHLLDFVGGAEAVKEVQEGHAALNGRKVGHCAKVHDLLRVGGSQQRKAGLTAGHDVLMVAENGEAGSAEGACGDVQHSGLELARYPVQVGHHQQQALRGGEGRGQGACRQRAVDRAGGATLRLHLGHLDLLAEKIFAARSRPVIHQLGHDRRGGDGEDGRHFRKGVGHMGGRRVAIHGFHGAWGVKGGHVSFLLGVEVTESW